MLGKANGTFASKRALAISVAFVASFASLAKLSPAEAQSLPLIRDSEIEALLSDYAKPIFRTAGLGSGRVTVRIVRNDAFNAFVLDGSNVISTAVIIFFYSNYQRIRDSFFYNAMKVVGVNIDPYFI